MITRKFHQVIAAVQEAAEGLEFLNGEGYSYENFVNALHEIQDTLDAELPGVDYA